MKTDARRGADAALSSAASTAWLEATLAQRFHERVVGAPTHTALRDGALELDYAALGARVAAIAARLTREGVRPGDVVAVLADTGADGVAAILAVLHAGAVFAPLDVLDPPARAGAMTRLARARHVLATPSRAAQAAATAQASERDVRVVPVPSGLSDMDAPAAVAPAAPASIFFTSGSTGAPKAVLDTHRNVLHNVLRYTALLGIDADDRCSLVQRLGFSGIASTLFSTLLGGGTLCTYPLSAERLPQLADWALGEELTIFHSVPSIFRALAATGRAFGTVRVVRLEGDRASWDDVRLFRQVCSEEALLANGLGTTETGLACQFRIGRAVPVERGILPVGFAAPGVDVLVLDDEGDPVLPGDAGEIAVRSSYLAQGYVDAPELTAERFHDVPGTEARMYLTGDLGRFGEAGRLEYLGRRDGRLKIAGVAVEPSEVEAALMALPGVRDAAVVVGAGRHGSGRLTAAVVADERVPSAERLREQLGTALPAVMIPTTIELVDDLAVGSHFKLERRAPVIRPRTDLERVLCDVWENVLGTPVGVHDRFVDLGGDSLAAAEVATGIERELDRRVSMSLLARASTVEELAAALTTDDHVAGVRCVVLREGTAGHIPVVFVAPTDGSTLTYAPLARSFQPTVPVWGLELSPSQLADPAIPSVAEQCVSALVRARPAGPFVLAGYCYGAAVALEMTRLLRLRGEQVELLVYGMHPTDLPGLSTADALERASEALAQRDVRTLVRNHIARARHLSAADAAAFVLRKVANVGLRAVGRHRRRYTTNPLERAAPVYRPAPLTGRATVFCAATSVARYADDPSVAWAPLADEVVVRVLPGDDAGLLHGKGAAALAAAIATVLAEVTVDETSG